MFIFPFSSPACFHIRSEHGIDPRLVALLFPEPVEEIRVQADGDGPLRRGNHDAGLFPECRICRARRRIVLKRTPDLRIAQRADSLPISACRDGRSSSMLLFHAALPSMPK